MLTREEVHRDQTNVGILPRSKHHLVEAASMNEPTVLRVDADPMVSHTVQCEQQRHPAFHHVNVDVAPLCNLGELAVASCSSQVCQPEGYLVPAL